MVSNLSYLDLHSIMAAASSEKVGEDRSGVSGVLSPSEVREASLDLNSEISCRSEARASLDGGPPRFIELQLSFMNFFIFEKDPSMAHELFPKII